MHRAPLRRIAAVFLLGTVTALLGVAGCQTPEPALPPVACQPGGCPPGQWPSLPPPAPDLSPTAVAPGLMPAFVGFPCMSTEDLICGWGKCLAGRCGGCQTTDDCKPGGICGWTPIGMACVYGGYTPPPR